MMNIGNSKVEIKIGNNMATNLIYPGGSYAK